MIPLEPLVNPWYLLARSLVFQPSVRTVYQAVQDKLL
jgi:UDP-glucose 4-epimerase